MKIINKDQFDAVQGLQRGRGGSTNPVIIALSKLEVGQALRVNVSEWKAKASYASGVQNHGMYHNKQFKVKTAADRKSFAVLRIR